MKIRPFAGTPVPEPKEPFPSSAHESLLRLAEEIGRLIGKFLADDASKNGRREPSPSPTQEK